MATLKLTRFATPDKFLAGAEAYWLAREAENTLSLSIAYGLRSGRMISKLPPYLGLVESHGQIVATAVMTPPLQAVLAWSDHEEAVRMLAGDVWSFREATPGVHGPNPTGAWFSDAWSALTSREPRLSMRERLYVLTQVRAVPAPGGVARPVVKADWPRLARWLVDFQAEALPHDPDPTSEADVLARWEALAAVPATERGQWVWVVDGDIASYVAYGGATPNGMRIGPVYTPPAARRHGYASALTAAVSQTVLDLGKRFVSLYTDLANPTSNKIYQMIGYEPVCDVDEYSW